ncbi:MAG: gas vesicle protein GvpN [Candidatus Omnitrophica bacterium]|nr:gas vesicle protein GvpN [Candidatus Omnitrophota bacterium]
MLEPEPGFVETLNIKRLTERALSYLKAGYPVHFSGPAGVGKTTLAMHLARTLGRPACFMVGDDEFGSSDLVGGQCGYRRKKVVDRFIHSVLKMEDDVTSRWVDARLTEACKNGLTLIYDEFNRSRPEANNVLLSVLEEGVMTMPPASGEAKEAYLEVHPSFRAIFTSNPEEYAGVHKTQDALRDRLVTIELFHYDEETEIAITMSRTKLTRPEAAKIVKLVRAIRQKGPSKASPTIRACIIIGKVAKLRKARIDRRDERFREICGDVLASTNHAGRNGSGLKQKLGQSRQLVERLLRRHC